MDVLVHLGIKIVTKPGEVITSFTSCHVYFWVGESVVGLGWRFHSHGFTPVLI